MVYNLTLVLLVTGAIGQSPRMTDIPRVFHGKTAAQWSDLMKEATRPEDRLRAAVSLSYFGPEGKSAIPVLLEIARSEQDRSIRCSETAPFTL